MKVCVLSCFCIIITYSFVPEMVKKQKTKIELLALCCCSRTSASGTSVSLARKTRRDTEKGGGVRGTDTGASQPKDKSKRQN